MSNPITDTAEYFAEKERNKNTKPNLRIFPSQDQQASPSNLNLQDLLSPESPESRQPSAPQHHNLSDFDPKAQWQKVLKRLPNRHANKSENDDDTSSASSSDDDQHGSDKDAYEMNRFGRPYRQKRNKHKNQQYNDQDDVLPDTNDISEKGENNVEPPTEEEQKNDNYFAKPFDESGSGSNISSKSTAEAPIAPTLDAVVEEEKHNIKKKQKQAPSSSHMSSGSSSDSDESPNEDISPINQADLTPTSPDDGRAKKHWGKTLDKVRLIANLHTLPHQPKTVVNSTSSLAPYYPPLFDPVFIALSKDQHGHPWVMTHFFNFFTTYNINIFSVLNVVSIATCFTSFFKSKSNLAIKKN